MFQVEQKFVNLESEIKIKDLIEGDQKALTLAIEDALREVVNEEVIDSDLSIGTNQKGQTKLYLGSFDSLSQADQFKQIIKKRNDKLIDINNLKIFEKLEDQKKYFTVELVNIGSEEEGRKLCSILSSRQFSCLLFN